MDLSLWLALYHTEGLTHSLYSRLLLENGSPEAILANCHTLADLISDSTLIAAIERATDPNGAAAQKASRDLDWQQQDDQHIIPLTDPDYPPLLRQIHCPPPLLFVRGQRSALCLPQIAIVGSRNASLYGKQTASIFARSLGAAGLSICSGLASGIDTAAHSAAVSADKPTIAVLGNGLDTLYPPRNRTLAMELQAHGALVSEFPRDASPRPEHFPRRNRIISGMSVGVLVVEAALRSGSLITARLAMEQNREVFAVPGSIRSYQSRGCHRLIREGATLVESAEEILDPVGTLLGYQLSLTESGADGLSKTPDVDAGDDRQLLECLGADAIPVNELIELSGIGLQELTCSLTRLELKSLVRLVPGGYVRI